MQDAIDHLLDRLAAERPRPGQALVEHDPQAEHVRAAVQQVPFAAGLFGTHVRGRAGVARRFAKVLFLQGQAEIGQVGMTRAVQQDIARFDVAVDDARAGARGATPRRWPPSVRRTEDAGRDSRKRTARLLPSMYLETI